LVSSTTSSSPVAPNSFTRFLSTGYNLQIEKRTSGTVNFFRKKTQQGKEILLFTISGKDKRGKLRHPGSTPLGEQSA
jgi:hypothetical protein